MESVGKRQRQVRITVGKDIFIPGDPSTAAGYVNLPVSYTENLADKFSCPAEEETHVSPANIRRLLNIAPVQDKLSLSGLSTRAEDYMAVYRIPATSIPAQDVRDCQGSVCLTPKNPGQLVNTRKSARAQNLNDLENSAALLHVKAQQLTKSIDEAKRSLQVAVRKVHTPHLQVLIQRACNNLASKLGLEKESNRSWFEFLKSISEDQWSQVEPGRDADEILIETSKWLDLNLATTTEDMAKAIRYLKKLGDGDDLDDQDLLQVNSAAGDTQWDKASRLESVEDVLEWDKLFKLASGSDKSFTEFLDLVPSSSPVLLDRHQRSRSSYNPS